jgi:hypothetical protein
MSTKLSSKRARTPWHIILAAPALVGVATIALGGCPGTLDDLSQFGSCGDVPATIIAPKCATAGCHSGAMPQSGIDMSAAGLSGRVLGKKSPSCSGLLVDPANPEKSTMYTKTTDSPPCGSKMPLGAPLSAYEQQCILSWAKSLSTGTTSSTSTSTSTSGMGGGGGAGGGMPMMDGGAD